MPRVNNDIQDRFMRFARAKKNYNTLRKSNCWICGVALEAADGFVLSDSFGMDRRGHFYCGECGDNYLGVWNIYDPDEEKEL